ncbi:hypothetical protein L218DRAFT_994906 [Marasmius fiardii PR-910]|nr:hypothetical protein L218DRAFT_994906 [Marasmius fiardii PR-910]
MAKACLSCVVQLLRECEAKATLKHPVSSRPTTKDFVLFISTSIASSSDPAIGLVVGFENYAIGLVVGFENDAIGLVVGFENDAIASVSDPANDSRRYRLLMKIAPQTHVERPCMVEPVRSPSPTFNSVEKAHGKKHCFG